MSIGVSCPQPNDNITVHVSGSQQTICVGGTYSSTLGFFRRLALLLRALFRWLLRLFRRRPAQLTTATVRIIRVRVLAGSFTTAPSPTPSQPGDYDISPPTSPWCCNPIQLPSPSGSSTQYTAFAWLLASTDGTVSILDGPHIVPFTAGGSGPTTDCCVSSGSGSAAPLLARELASQARLEVAVPDGPNAGLHTATTVSSLAWELTLRGVTYRVCCDPGPALVIRGPSSSAPAHSVEGGPFSATFPGAVLGAVGEVVVTKG
jgi:hypothetical protein